MRPPKFRLFKRGGVWQIDVRWKGVRYPRRSLGVETRGEADEAAPRVVAELTGFGLAAGSGSPGTPFLIEQAVAEFRRAPLEDVSEPTRDMYRSKALHLKRVLKGLDVGALTAADVKRFIETRRTEKGAASDHTIAKELVTFRKLLSFCQDLGHVQPGWRALFPERFRSGYDPRDRWLTEEEYPKLLAAVESDRRLWITTGVYTGGRVSELERIQCPRDLDFKHRFVTLRSAKTRRGEPRKPRHIPMAPELRKALLAAGADKRIGPLFPDPWKNPALMLTRMAWKAGIAKAPVFEKDPITGKPVLKERGETINDNDLRRTFASWMLQRGAKVKEVADLLGHGSTAMVERVYGHLARQNLIDAVGRLPRFRKRKAD
jgi:integrase